MAKNARGAGRPVKTAGATTEVAGASIARSRGIGALVVAAGAALMIAGVFLPWLSYSGEPPSSPAGGSTRIDANTGGNGFVITRMFTPGDPQHLFFFTGFTISSSAPSSRSWLAVWVLGLARSGSSWQAPTRRAHRVPHDAARDPRAGPRGPDQPRHGTRRWPHTADSRGARALRRRGRRPGAVPGDVRGSRGSARQGRAATEGELSRSRRATARPASCCSSVRPPWSMLGVVAQPSRSPLMTRALAPPSATHGCAFLLSGAGPFADGGIDVSSIYRDTLGEQDSSSTSLVIGNA